MVTDMVGAVTVQIQDALSESISLADPMYDPIMVTSTIIDRCMCVWLL